MLQTVFATNSRTQSDVALKHILCVPHWSYSLVTGGSFCWSEVKRLPVLKQCTPIPPPPLLGNKNLCLGSGFNTGIGWGLLIVRWVTGQKSIDRTTEEASQPWLIESVRNTDKAWHTVLLCLWITAAHWKPYFSLSYFTTLALVCFSLYVSSVFWAPRIVLKLSPSYSRAWFPPPSSPKAQRWTSARRHFEFVFCRFNC